MTPPRTRARRIPRWQGYPELWSNGAVTELRILMEASSGCYYHGQEMSDFSSIAGDWLDYPYMSRDWMIGRGWTRIAILRPEKRGKK